MGDSFHFAPRKRGESFKDSIVRHQRFIGDSLSIKSGQRVIDLGCGMGCPVRNISQWYYADFVGLNLSLSQVERAKELSQEPIDKNVQFI
ncbi:MAG: class I SAM-dependent methyltransferase [Bacteroidetes bacterium]|nr:class I SAM-dependent methyltransferase [Bacteroidota bacterium]